LRKENWDYFTSLNEFKEMDQVFNRIKKELNRNRKIVKNVTYQRKALLYEHFQTLHQKYMKEKELNPNDNEPDGN